MPLRDVPANCIFGYPKLSRYVAIRARAVDEEGVYIESPLVAADGAEARDVSLP